METDNPDLEQIDWDDWQVVHLHPRVSVPRLIDALQGIGLEIGHMQDRGLCIVPVGPMVIPPAPSD